MGHRKPLDSGDTCNPDHVTLGLEYRVRVRVRVRVEVQSRLSGNLHTPFGRMRYPARMANSAIHPSGVGK